MGKNDKFLRYQFSLFDSSETKWRHFFPHPPAKLAPMDYVRPMGRAIEGYRIGCPHLPAWPTEGSQFCLKNGLILAKLAQNFKFRQSTASYHKVALKIEFGAPNYIQLATKNVFLALKIPKLQSGAKKRQWRHFGDFGALNGARWRSKLGQTSVDIHKQ